MANFVFKKDKWFGSESDKIEADVFIDSSATYTRKVPMHPVQGRTKVGDHIIVDPVIVSINAVISETPLYGIEETEEAMENRKEEVRLLRDKLVQMNNDTTDSTIITISDGADRYENMTLKSLIIPKKSDDGDSLNFSASFTEIILVDKEFVEVDGINSTGSDGSKSDMANAKDKGSVTKVDAKGKTPLRSMADSIFGEDRVKAIFK